MSLPSPHTPPPPPTLLAHEALQSGLSPIIIDNTNTAAWEMKPYVTMVGGVWGGAGSVWVHVTLSPSTGIRVRL